jgi:SAM-dependent methyltransferase
MVESDVAYIQECLNAGLVQSGKAAEIICPVCQRASSLVPLYRYHVAQAASHFCPPSRDANRFSRLSDCIRRLWNGDECTVFRCTDCGFAFGNPFVGGDEEFYGILHEQKDYPGWRWDYDVAVAEALEKFDGGKILDVGAGVGMFLGGLSGAWDCHAVEGSETTRRDLSDGAQLNAGSFQVITLFQVLEHIAEFGLVLKLCRKLLAPGGRLVVTVPDGDAMIRQERMTGCHDMPPNHIVKWTPESLSRVLRRSGFECGQPIYEPRSWRNLKANLHMRLVADAINQNSLAAQAYRIRSKPLRIAALTLLAGPALLRMLPYRTQLCLGGAFAVISVKT